MSVLLTFINTGCYALENEFFALLSADLSQYGVCLEKNVLSMLTVLRNRHASLTRFILFKFGESLHVESTSLALS